MKKVKVIITLDMKCPDDRKLLSLKEISENVLNELSCNTMIVPWNQGYKGKITARVENEKDNFSSWCLLEEIEEQYYKTRREYDNEKEKFNI